MKLAGNNRQNVRTVQFLAVKNEIWIDNVATIYIIVEYGVRIPEIAFEIQTKVKKAVETMTGLKVREVNVNVQGVHAITEKNTEENSENN